MAAVPHYWTQFALDLASKEPLLLDALLWSKDLPFTILIFDSRLHASGAQARTQGLSQEQERIAVEALTTALQPHLQRCEALSYDVEYSGSIPTLIFALEHCSEKLEKLELDFIRDDCEPFFRFQGCEPCIPAPVSPSWTFPALERLSIDAKTFMFVAGHPMWRDLITSAEPEYGLTLEISRHTFLEEPDNVLVVESLSCFFHYLAELHSVTTLILRDLSSHPHVTENTLVPTKKLLGAYYFEGINLSRDFLSVFFKVFDLPGEATFVACAFPSNTSLGSSESLTLKSLPMNSRFERCFQGWRGEELTFDRCPSFDNDTLDLLAEISGYEDCCPASRVSSLTIRNCHNFSYQALKELVLQRKRMAPAFEFVKEIRTLILSGKIPRITKEELEWFEGNVKHVYMSGRKSLPTE